MKEILLVLVIGCTLLLAACATLEPPAKPAFPPDMRVVCYQGAYWIGSVDADQVVRLPLSCT